MTTFPATLGGQFPNTEFFLSRPLLVIATLACIAGTIVGAVIWRRSARWMPPTIEVAQAAHRPRLKGDDSTHVLYDSTNGPTTTAKVDWSRLLDDADSSEPDS